MELNIWFAERGVCLPTICLWVLFIYVEASIRLKDLKHFPAHLDLCRPFAAHCIGYPVVTWGFDIKGYISYRIRQVCFKIDFKIVSFFSIFNVIEFLWNSVNNGRWPKRMNSIMNCYYNLFLLNNKKRITYEIVHHR